jgi:hypothetical protein
VSDQSTVTANIVTFQYDGQRCLVTAHWLEPRHPEDAKWEIRARLPEHLARAVGDAATIRLPEASYAVRCWDELPHDKAVALVEALDVYHAAAAAAVLPLATLCADLNAEAEQRWKAAAEAREKRPSW